MEFKVGDKVKCTAKHCASAYGKEFEVIEIERNEFVKALGETRVHTFHKENIELVKQEEKTFENQGTPVFHIEIPDAGISKHKRDFHSSHYESDSIEPIEFMMSNKLDFCRGSIIKYAFRAGKKKGQEALDIKKIIDYAILLAQQEGIDFTYQDAKDIIDYRFEWREK